MIDENPSKLEAYRKKRDPGRTPEPFGERPPETGSSFVVHLHAARNLHYDLRLEMEGVLRSWAVPKGPSTRAEEKRLAVLVEDHPLEYGEFEGTIPAGNYGAGQVIIWDHGRYGSFKPEPILEQFERGKMELEFFGFKLRGRWTLVRMSRKEKEWLLLKKVDSAATEQELIERYPHSVVSGLTVEERKDPAAKLAPVLARLDALGAPRAKIVAARQPFMLATLEEKPFSRKDWIFEIKYDGVRVLAARTGDEVEMYGRSGQAIDTKYPEIARALLRLPVERFVLDGEIVAPDETGQPSFQRLQARMGLTKPRDVAQAMRRVPVTAVFFDCLELDGRDLRGLALVERKQAMQALLPPLGKVRYGDHVPEQGVAFFDAASAHRLEGIVAKKAKSTYRAGRSTEWMKIKCQKRQEFVVGGYTDPQGSRGRFGALHIGIYEDGKLVYVSRVGTGFDGDGLEETWKKLQPLGREASPFDKRSPKGKGHHWVEPKLVCEVRFTEWTDDGGLRHPTFVGFREDKRPEDVRREDPETLLSGDGDAPAPEEPPAEVQKTVNVSNLNKVFWPADGYTKGDLIAYYDAVAALILPYLRDRPLTLTRYPDGIDGKSFYQKDAPSFVPKWLRTEPVYSKDSDREIRYFIVDDRETLRYVANMGTIPLHFWASRVGSLDKPDWLVIDLDPKGAPFADVIEMAKVQKEILDELELPSYIKTSGKTGLHIHVPLGARYTYEEARTFARLLATLAHQARPEISTLARAVGARGGKVYVDFGQNGHGQTVVAPFSVRPLPGAPVSCPIEWKEVNAKLDPKKYTIKTVLERFAKRDDPMLPMLKGGVDLAATLGKVQGRLKQD